MIRISYDHTVFQWNYKTYKSIIAVEIYAFLMETNDIISLEGVTKELDTLFDYNLQEGPKLRLLNITVVQSENGIKIDKTDQIINDTIQKYWVTKTKKDVNFHG